MNDPLAWRLTTHAQALPDSQDRLPVWLGGWSLDTMRLAAARGWNVMRNFGSDAEHRDALEDYIKIAAGNGYARSGANMMIERFIAIGETEDQAERNLDRLAWAFRHFLSLYIAGLQQVIDTTGARRLLVETFSREEARLFAREVIPVLKERNEGVSP